MEQGWQAEGNPDQNIGQEIPETLVSSGVWESAARAGEVKYHLCYRWLHKYI